MNSIELGQGVSLGMEAVCALFGGGKSFAQWYNKRFDLITNSMFDLNWGSVGDQQTKQFFLRRIDDFSATLKDCRITKVDMYTHDREFVTFAREIRFSLGSDRDPSMVIIGIHIALVATGEDPISAVWPKWSIQREESIFCHKHPDKKFEGIVLGAELISSED